MKGQPDTFPKSNGQQRKYLKDRLNAVRYSRHLSDEPTPREVKLAEKVLDKWQASQRKRQKDLTRRLDVARERAQQAILFESADIALKLVVSYEEMVAEFNTRG